MLWQALWLPGTFLDAGARPPIWAAVLGGAGIGLGWGVLARVGMRAISADPEFSVEGTAFILVAFSQAGAFAGLAFAARRRDWRRWRLYVPRTLSVLAVIPLGFGSALIAVAVLAVLGVARRDWPVVLRFVFVVLALAGLLSQIARRITDPDRTILRTALVVPLTLWVAWGEFLAFRVGVEPAVHAAARDEAGQPSVIVGASPTTG